MRDTLKSVNHGSKFGIDSVTEVFWEVTGRVNSCWGRAIIVQVKREVEV